MDAQVNFATGPGPWTGPFDSYSVSGDILTGSLSPNSGVGYDGVSFGGALGPPGAGCTPTTYTKTFQIFEPLMMSAFEIVVIVWFGSAFLIHYAGTVALRRWLRRRHVRWLSLLAGCPGYLERFYREWCRSNGQSAKTVLILRSISLINLIAASVFLMLIANKR